MKKQILLLFFILLSLVTYSQTSNKLIINFNAHRNDFARPTEDQFRNSFWSPSIEYLRRKGRRILSFELAKFTHKTLGAKNNKVSNPLQLPLNSFIIFEDKNTQALLRMQYQRLTKVLISDKIISVNPYYGIALTPHYAFTKRIPLFSILTGKEITSIGATAHASLGMYLQFRRFFINVNTLLGIAQFEMVQEYLQDASLTNEQQHINYNEFKLMPKDNLFRIGIGLGI